MHLVTSKNRRSENASDCRIRGSGDRGGLPEFCGRQKLRALAHIGSNGICNRRRGLGVFRIPACGGAPHTECAGYVGGTLRVPSPRGSRPGETYTGEMPTTPADSFAAR